MNTASFVFTPDGIAHGLYTEAIDLTRIGRLTVKRASQIEFNDRAQCWEVQTLGGRMIFSAPTRQQCLDWEQQYFTIGNGVPKKKGNPHAV
jgi:hypothetical protein